MSSLGILQDTWRTTPGLDDGTAIGQFISQQTAAASLYSAPKRASTRKNRHVAKSNGNQMGVPVGKKLDYDSVPSGATMMSPMSQVIFHEHQHDPSDRPEVSPPSLKIPDPLQPVSQQNYRHHRTFRSQNTPTLTPPPGSAKTPGTLLPSRTRGSKIQTLSSSLSGLDSRKNGRELLAELNLRVSRSRTDFEFIERIGKGAFGRVYKARHRVDSVVYAVKKISFWNTGNAALVERKVLREVKCLAKLDSPYVCRYYNAWLEPVWESADTPGVRKKKKKPRSMSEEKTSGFNVPSLVHHLRQEDRGSWSHSSSFTDSSSKGGFSSSDDEGALSESISETIVVPPRSTDQHRKVTETEKVFDARGVSNKLDDNHGDTLTSLPPVSTIAPTSQPIRIQGFEPTKTSQPTSAFASALESDHESDTVQSSSTEASMNGFRFGSGSYDGMSLVDDYFSNHGGVDPTSPNQQVWKLCEQSFCILTPTSHLEPLLLLDVLHKGTLGSVCMADGLCPHFFLSRLVSHSPSHHVCRMTTRCCFRLNSRIPTPRKAPKRLWIDRSTCTMPSTGRTVYSNNQP